MTEQGLADMSALNQAVATGKTSTQEMNEAMQNIQEAGSSISTVIKTIDQIAFQTNILALNAAVEAARAGEAGAGLLWLQMKSDNSHIEVHRPPRRRPILLVPLLSAALWVLKLASWLA